MNTAAARMAAVVAPLAAALSAAALTLEPVGEFPLPPDAAGAPIVGLSGITWEGGKRFHAVRDSKGFLYALDLTLDPADGAVKECRIAKQTELRPTPFKIRCDHEGIAWDPLLKCVWVSDEDDGSIRAFSAGCGRQKARLEVPALFDAYRFNRSFESLSIRSTGLELWTCNEEALCRREAIGRHGTGPGSGPDVDDGPRSTREAGSTVRIQKFTRESADVPWRAAGQWSYVTDSLGGRSFLGKSCSGVSDLCVLDDGTLLALEREMSIKNRMMPSFRCRIYRVDLSEADDVSQITALVGAGKRPAAKKLVFEAQTGFAMYEGICLGPTLADGSRAVVMVSDGDDGAVTRLFVLRLRL